jgi:AbrB family looped-hinge helix DNA binding protein
MTGMIVLPGITLETSMEITSVTSKGQVTIPKEVRQQLGIRQGSRIEFALVDDHVEMRVKSSPTGAPDSGFGMLKSRRTAVPADFDPATLLKR